MKILLFTAPWCQPCKVLKPLVEQLDGIEVELIDIERDVERAVQHSVKGVPTMVAVDGNGMVLGQHQGPMSSLHALKTWVKDVAGI